jgi:polysaccharide transporter, PST family
MIFLDKTDIKDNLVEKTINSGIWSFTQGVGQRAIQFLTYIILARLLTPEDFGLVAIGILYTNFVEVFIDQGFGEAIVQRKDLQHEHLNAAFLINISIGLFFAVISFFLAEFISVLFSEQRLISIIRWFSLIFIIGGFKGVQEAYFQKNMEFKKLAVRSIIAALAGGVVGISMAYMGYGAMSLVGQQFAFAAVGVWILWATSEWRPTIKMKHQHIKDLYLFGINIFFIRMLNFINQRMDHLIIGLVLGPKLLGYYTVASRFLNMTTGVLSYTIAKVAYSAFSIVQRDTSKLRSGYYIVTEISAFVAFPFFVLIALLAPEVVLLIFGEKWMPAVPAFRILSFMGILHALLLFNGPLIKARGKPFVLLVIKLINSTANIAAVIIGIQWGIVGVAAAYVIRGYVFSVVELRVVFSYINIEIKKMLKRLYPPVVATLGMTICFYIMKLILIIENEYISILLYVIVPGIIYFIIMKWLNSSLFAWLIDNVKMINNKV